MIETDQQVAIRKLAESVPVLKRISDLAGLIQVRAQARTIALETEGRLRRKAERVERKADAAVTGLRRAGIETKEEHARRQAEEAREANRLARGTSDELARRVQALLHLWLDGAKPPGPDVEALRRLFLDSGESDPLPFDLWSERLIDGYEGSRRIHTAAAAWPAERERPVIVRTLKAAAVELLAAGGTVRGLTSDAVPLVAYSLFGGRLPIRSTAESAVAVEESIDDLLLVGADKISEMDAGSRAQFVALFRMAVLLGEAQVYAERLGLTVLQFD